MPERTSSRADMAHDRGRSSRSKARGIVVGSLVIVAVAMFAFAGALYPFETGSVMPVLEVEPAERPLGNVDFAPASSVTLTIASRIDQVVIENEDTSPSGARTTAGPTAPGRHWVQLGALTKAATAARYWDVLKDRFPALLADRPHRILAPEETGSRLFHLRLGPMDSAMAGDLCTRILDQGGDCFCVPAAALDQDLAGPADMPVD